MKKQIITFYLILLSIISYAQYDITISYNSVHIGQNVNIGIMKTINNHEIGVGIKFLINSKVSDDQNEIFKKRFYAKSFTEAIGLNIDYHYKFLNHWLIKPFFFYNFQLTNSHTRNRGFVPYDYSIDGTVLYKEYLDYLGPTIALENYIGIGYAAWINKRFYLSQKAGIGLVNYFNVDEKLVGGGSNWEFGYIINFGLGYRI